MKIAIQRMIEAIQRMMTVSGQGAVEETKEGWKINPAMKRDI